MKSQLYLNLKRKRKKPICYEGLNILWNSYNQRSNVWHPSTKNTLAFKCQIFYFFKDIDFYVTVHVCHGCKFYDKKREGMEKGGDGKGGVLTMISALQER